MSSYLNYSVIATDTFKKQAKKLARKYPSLKDELKKLSDTLKANPTIGTFLGKNIYKIRIAIKSKKSGKSGGARIITYVLAVKEEVHMLSIYDKSYLEEMKEKRIDQIVKDINSKL